MIEPLRGRKRTHTCGDLRAEHAGERVRLMGWAHRVRDHGGVLFLDLRDRYGITQVVFRPEKIAPPVLEKARAIGSEYVVLIEGTAKARPPGSENAELLTGAMEVEGDQLAILNQSKTPPFPLDDGATASEDLRLRYRYLDLRRDVLKDNMIFRHRMTRSVREYLSDQGFLEIETPLLVKPTPEGARDYVVPARLHPGKFYALPQSPQLYKQILMVAGFDRYFQIARCLRDEDLRADRQPEFTQIDLEMSFVTEEDVFEVVEGTLKSVFRRDLDRELAIPFPRISYDEAMARFGSDKPDTRFELMLTSISEVVKDSGFKVFAEAPGKVVVKFGQFLSPDCGDLCNVFDLFAGQPFGGEIFGIANRKSFLVVSPGAQEIFRKFRLDIGASKFDFDVVHLDMFRIGFVNESTLEIYRDCVASLRTTILDWLKGSGLFAQTLNQTINVFIGNGPHSSNCVQTFIFVKYYFGYYLDMRVYVEREVAKLIARGFVFQMNIRLADYKQTKFLDGGGNSLGN